MTFNHITSWNLRKARFHLQMTNTIEVLVDITINMTLITLTYNYYSRSQLSFIYIKTSVRYMWHVIMLYSNDALLLTNDVTCKMTGSIIPLVVPTNHQSTAFITPVVIGLSWQPVVVVPLWFIRPSEVSAGLPGSLPAQPEPVIMGQLCYELILLLGVDWGQISLIRKY